MIALHAAGLGSSTGLVVEVRGAHPQRLRPVAVVDVVPKGARDLSQNPETSHTLLRRNYLIYNDAALK